MLLFLLALVTSATQAGAGASSQSTSDRLPDTPLDARYEIAGEIVSLVNGRAESRAAPGSAAKARTRVVARPVSGDIDGDGDADAVVWLARRPGGSGTFYYLAAALDHRGGFRGTSAFFIGDRIEPREVLIAHRVITARFADRRTGEPMAAPPTLEYVMHFTLTADGLVAAADRAEENALMHGSLIIGHEVRSFQPCGEGRSLWLTGDAATIRSLVRAHRTALPGAAPYAPLFASVLGHRTGAPETGFGADHDGAFAVRELVQTWPAGNCTSDRVVVEAPLPGSTVGTPLEVRGRARGAWFFEGEIRLELLDADRDVVARGYATAQAEWMTRDFVPFIGGLRFENLPDDRPGVLVVRNNNPSENRDLDEILEIPIRFR